MKRFTIFRLKYRLFRVAVLATAFFYSIQVNAAPSGSVSVRVTVKDFYKVVEQEEEIPAFTWNNTDSYVKDLVLSRQEAEDEDTSMVVAKLVITPSDETASLPDTEADFQNVLSMDITLFKEVTSVTSGVGVEKVEQLSQPVTLSFALSEDMYDKDGNFLMKSYSFVRQHGGDCEELPLQFNHADREATFSTDRFSIYTFHYTLKDATASSGSASSSGSGHHHKHKPAQVLQEKPVQEEPAPPAPFTDEGGVKKPAGPSGGDAGNKGEDVADIPTKELPVDLQEDTVQNILDRVFLTDNDLSVTPPEDVPQKNNYETLDGQDGPEKNPGPVIRYLTVLLLFILLILTAVICFAVRRRNHQ